MIVINDAQGKQVSRSQNLRGLTRYASKCRVAAIHLTSLSGGEGCVVVCFRDGATCKVQFGSWTVLKGWVRRWRNAKGASLMVDGKSSGLL